jgi:hypothetical protein
MIWQVERSLVVRVVGVGVVLP